MSSMRLLSRVVSGRARAVGVQQARYLGAGPAGPLQPEFGAQPPPTTSLPFDNDLIWHDSTAPETIIDFDAQHISTGQAASSFAAAFALLGAILGFCYLKDPEGSADTVPLNYAAPEGQSALDMGLTDYKYGDDEGEEE